MLFQNKRAALYIVMVFTPGYKWGQTDAHVIITLDVNEECVNKHDFTPEGKVLVEGDVPNKGAFKLHSFG